jgi:hypothetical protein
MPVAQLATRLPTPCWRRRTIKAGSKGPLVARFAKVREGLPGPDV